MKKTGIHFEPNKNFSNRLIRFEKILKYNNYEVQRLNSSDLNFWDEIKSFDYFLYYFGHWDSSKQNALSVLPIVEFDLKIPVFPDFKTRWAFDDKIREFYLMHSKSFPITKSWIFFEKDDALKWAENAQLPLIFKLKSGAGSVNISIIKNKKNLLKTINLMFNKGLLPGKIPNSINNSYIFSAKRKLSLLRRKLLKDNIAHGTLVPCWQKHKNYVLFQEFLPDNTFDTRVTTIGNKSFAFKRINRKNDYRSSGSGIIDYDQNSIDKRCIETALKISREMKFQTMSYDFLKTPENEIRFCEFSYGYTDIAIYNCPGYWDQEMNFHEGHFWPQHLILQDWLKDDNLKLPPDL